MSRFLLRALCLIPLFATVSCDLLRTKPAQSTGHLSAPALDSARIPALAAAPPRLPPPQPVKREATHTVVVSDVPVREVLFSLARDADVNLDLAEDVDGVVTLNAVNQTLPAILDRIAANSGLRYELNNKVISIRKDLPFVRNYRVDYLNMARAASSNVSVSTQISATGQGAGDAKGAGSGDNNSATQVKNSSDNSFWATLQKNIAAIIGGGTPAAGATAEAGAGADHPDIMLNKESGIMGVRATERQHAEIARFIAEVQTSSERQVLIEATIAEVKLNDRYQAGINWNLVRDGSQHDIGVNLNSAVNDLALGSAPAFSLAASTVVDNNLLQATLKALETFGNVSIMSSPKVMALNNQTALLKVVDNLVYFTVDVNIDTASTAVAGASRTVTYQTKVNTVPVGFVMSVTPYINEQGAVTLNVRPTISRVISQVRDPNPSLAEANVVSEIPVIQVREVESVLKVNSGDIAVIGGLMQDETNNAKTGIPVLGKLPGIGAAFRYQDDKTVKTELVIFIRPMVVQHASLTSDLRAYKEYLPSRANPAPAGQPPAAGRE
ncbi:MAG TPA: pilus (MSHA type) biogenesis protein MshL [Marinagarivorans sp.]|nr:pilus (MSHA type) biogenesis protein MshL [Cellvibrionaceae bacterium]HMY40404.1 pilus (MSHA type) biogenesis protein MshL [Marinagarivorans sp.]